MQKIILDTNVIVSALISKSSPYFILDALVLSERVELLLSPSIWEEYIEVLNRDKFTRFPHFKVNAELVLGYVKKLSTILQPIVEVKRVKDLSDNKFLELALEGNADFLITGNTKDFNFETFEKTKIISPSAYWETHKPE